MGTFLTNSKMSPELRARIETSLRGGRSASRSRLTPSLRTALRLVAVLVVVGSVVALLLDWRRSRRELQNAKAALIDEVEQARSGLDPPDKPLWSSAQAWLAEASGTTQRDYVDPPLNNPVTLAALLEQPAVYVRGSISGFATVSGFERAAADSGKDSFLACLLQPPASRSEKDLLPKVEAAYRGGAASNRETPRVHRLHDAIVAQPFIEDAWLDQVRNAGSVPEVNDLRKSLEQAQLERSGQAVQAKILIYLLDEPKEPGTASELDGASDHFVRFGIVDFNASQVALRLRRRIDPSWISKAKRVYLARGLNACRLAFDVRQELEAGDGD